MKPWPSDFYFPGKELVAGAMMPPAKTICGYEDMRASPVLSADRCLQVVIDSTPHPDRFQKTDDPTLKMLFDLGVVDALSSALFVQNVKAGIAPWHIDDASIQSSRGNTVQEAADSVQTGAISVDSHEE